MPFTSQFEMSDSFLVNNFSFLFALLSLSMVSVLVSYVIYKIKKRKNHNKNQVLSSEGKKNETQRKTLIDVDSQK